MEDLEFLNKVIGKTKIGEISIQTVVWLLILAFIIFCSFYILKKYIVPYLSSRKAIKRAKYNQFRLEVLVWTVYAVFAIYNLLHDSLWISTILIVLVALVGFNFWRNLFIGIVFRLDNKFSIGDPIKYDKHVGILFGINARNIQIKTEDEELIFIPYRKLSSSLLIKRQAKGKLLSAKIVLDVFPSETEDWIEKINRFLYECPWAIMNEKAQIQVLEDNKIAITVYFVDAESLERIELFLKKKISS